MLPLVAMPIETRHQPPTVTRSVRTQIRIAAPPGKVWENIKRIRPIQPSELPATWTHTIGFPRPIAAPLSYEGVGGVRKTAFEHGLTFLETIKRWEPEHLLSFSIKADTEHIPTTTLDEHVKVGGLYFDVLDGEYRLESLPDGSTLLHLSSRERLSTDFNS